MEYKEAKVLTIVVPCYNVEWCLEKCLSSFIDERILDELQVIVVNDGSVDGTLTIAKHFEECYPNTFITVDKENGGHGSTINVAVVRATGKYFKVIDADDWVITENLVRLIKILKNTSADVIVTNYHMVDMQTGNLREFRIQCAESGKLYTVDQYMQLPGQSLECFTFHGIWYRTECYRQSGVVLSEGVFYEDQEFATLPFCTVKTIIPLDLFLYQYLVGNANQSVSDQNQVKRLSHVVLILENLLQWYRRCSDASVGVKKYFKKKIADMLTSFYIICLIKNPDRKAGRADAAEFRNKLDHTDILEATDRKYKAALVMNRLHINSRQYEWLLYSGCYRIFRPIIRKK